MLSLWVDFSVGIYLIKLNIENFDKMSGICSKLTIKTVKHQKKWNLFKVGKLQWRCSVAFIVNLEHILHIILVSPLLTLSKSIQAGLISFFWGNAKWRENNSQASANASHLSQSRVEFSTNKQKLGTKKLYSK